MNLLDFRFKANSKEIYSRIYKGDCLKILPAIPSESVDLIFADPPYNISKKKGLGWEYSKHITMPEKWDIFFKD